MDNPALYVVPLAAAVLLVFTLVRSPGAVSFGRGPSGAPEPITTDPSQRPRAAVVFNPSKFVDAEEAKAIIARECQAHGWNDPLILETTPDDTGISQTLQALEADVDLVIACGGDGTVRAVAQELSRTDMTMGLLPVGTGNLLALNLDLPNTDLAGAIAVALTGDDRTIDVGWIQLDHGDEQAFVVMAGVGFDAELMAIAKPRLKSRMGPVAYVLAGLRRLIGPRQRVRMQIDDLPTVNQMVRSVIIGNCGRLHAGIALMPGAKIDDGRLDALLLSPKGIMGWASVVVAIVTRRNRDHRLVEHVQGEQVSLLASGPLTAQLDGDPVGKVRRAQVRVAPKALTVRVPPAPATS